MSGITRVIVKLTPAYRELVEDLEKLPDRSRAERMRSLALIGLAVSNGLSINVSVNGAALQVQPSATPPADGKGKDGKKTVRAMARNLLNQLNAEDD
jgi:hypothetical protein